MQQNFIIYFLASVRVVAMLVSSPVFSVRQIPAIVKVGLSLSISLIITSILNTSGVIVPNTLIELIVSCGKEIIVGALTGYISTLIFNAVRVSAQVMDFSIGFSMSQYYDPSTSGNSTPLERFFNWMALLIFMTFNFHHIIISAIIKSFEVVPVGIIAFKINFFSKILDIFSQSFYIAMQLAAPVVIVIFMTDFALGLVARTVPQLNIFMLGLPVKILAGLLAIAAILPGLSHIYIKVFESMSGDMLKFFNILPFIILMTSDDKTEEPTAKKLQEAKKKGQVPKSIDLNSAIILLGITFILSIMGNYFYNNGRLYIIESFKYLNKDDISLQNLSAVFIFNLKNGLIASLPVILTVMVLGITGNILQTGFILTSESLKFKFERINPIEGMKRFFNKRAFVELLKSISKVALISYIVFSFIKTKLNEILRTSDLNPKGIYPFVKNIIDSELIRLVIFLFAVGIVDYVFQRKQYKKELRMTKQEVKEEFKQMEGDPQIKSRIRQKQRAMAMRRMMHEVPKATVVVTNPTHYAIALRYEKDMESAPRVVAKGCDIIALKIKEIAKSSNVPIVENKNLARSLYAQVEIDELVPVELYQAVAEIIAYVYSMKNMRG